MIRERGIADYFIITGLPEQRKPLEEFCNDSQLKISSRHVPITDICVIIPSEREECPPGYEPLIETPSGHMADLNHGSIRSPEIILCFRRGRDKPPLTDIGVLYEGKERVLPGCEVVYETPYGRSANVNNSQTFRIFLTYRRAPETASSDTLSVTDICVVITSKDEQPPHSFCMIDKNLNKGTIMGSDVFLCYKKSMCKDYSIAYTPGVLGRYPLWDWTDFPLPADSIAMFGLPMGAALESWLYNARPPNTVFSTFVLTGVDGKKSYGAAITFYEKFDEGMLTEKEKRALGLSAQKKKRTVHVNKAICLLSRQPFFDAFRDFLMFLHHQAESGQVLDVPLERYVHHLLWEVPMPSPERPRIWMQLSAKDHVLFALPVELPIPQSGASFLTMLKNLGPENTVNLLTFTLLEQKILIHSLRPAVLTGVIEAVGSMIFPFSWQCPYIPLCPLGLADVLSAPVPFIVGVDSRYFDLYEPPSDVFCIDLDTNTISQPRDRTSLSQKMLPKRPCRVLRNTLESIFNQMRDEQLRALSHSNESLDGDVRKLAKTVSTETSIQEAFLRFMAAILKGYKCFLLPITSAPSLGATDARTLFDMQGFLRSRDKAYHKLFHQMLRTQTFIRFIEERSFNLRDDASFAFFDECTEKVDENYDVPKLLESDSTPKSERTVFISAPLPDEPADETPITYKYSTFPDHLDHRLFPEVAPAGATSSQGQPLKAVEKSGFIAKRSKAEIKAVLKVAQSSKRGVAASHLWAKCLMSSLLSLWFVHLPAFIHVSKSPEHSMRTALAILKKLQTYKLHTADEVCYRAMMQLCGIYQLPALAVKVLFEMKKQGLAVNAVTYGYYNKAVLESEWPADSSTARVMWRRLRHLIQGVARFRCILRNRSSSMYSLNASEQDSDSISRDSIDSIIEHKGKDDKLSSNSDTGYGSMSYEDLKREHLRLGLPSIRTTDQGSQFRCDAGDSDDAFRLRVGGIIRRSTARASQSGSTSGTQFDSSAGLLITATAHLSTEEDDTFQASSADSGWQQHIRLGEVIRRRHRSAGDHLARSSRQMAELSRSAIVDSNCCRDGKHEALLNLPSVGKPSVEEPNPKIVPSQCLDKDRSGRGLHTALLREVLPVAPEETVVYPCMQRSRTESSLKSQAQQHSATAAAAAAASPASSVRKVQVTSDDPLGLFGVVSTPVSIPSSAAVPVHSLHRSATEARIGQESNLVSMDISTLFGRDSPKRAPHKTSSSADDLLDTGVKKYNLLDLSPDQEQAPPTQPGNVLRKSTSLDSRSSYKAAIQESDASGDQQTDGLPRKRDSIDSKTSADSLDTSALPPAPTDQSSSSYKGWIASSIKRSTTIALGGGLTDRLKTMVYGKPKAEPAALMSSGESLNIESTPQKERSLPPDRREPGIAGDDGSPSLSRLKSISSNMANKLYSNYSKLKHTVKEYQSPSTVAPPYKSEGDAFDEHSLKANDITSRGISPAAADDYGQAVDDKIVAVDKRISYSSVPPSFVERFLPRPRDQSYEQSHDATKISQVEGQGEGQQATYSLLEINMCSATRCDRCSAVLYDEEIMAGWSEQDSDLSTVCRFCGQKQVPSLQITFKDFRRATTMHTENAPSHSSGVDPILNNSQAGLIAKQLSVPYLSPLVLRKELENVLDSDGDAALASTSFVQEHSIIYWNMIWYFNRLNLPSHLPKLLFGVDGVLGNHPDEQDLQRDPHNLTIHASWDNPALHDRLGIPMYKLWNENETKSSVIKALLTDEKEKSHRLMQQILGCIECADVYTPMRLILNRRRQHMQGNRPRIFHSLYRDLLFLCLVSFGPDVMDHDAFDREYKLAYRKLTALEKQYTQESDLPPTTASIWCRKLFGGLEMA